MSIKAILYRAGQQPERSWQKFLIGLLIFAAGLLLLLGSVRLHPALYWPGFVVVVLGFVFAALGYWGMFANRFARMIEQRSANAAHDPFADPEQTATLRSDREPQEKQ